MSVALLAAMGCADPAADVAAWLACEECGDELALVEAHGDAALEPLLVVLYRGPSFARQLNYRAQLTEQYRLARRAHLAPPVHVLALTDSSTFIADGLLGLVGSYRARAALALRALDTPAARAALHVAWQDDSAGFLAWPTELRALVEQLDRDNPVTLVRVTSQGSTLGVGGSMQLTAVVSAPIPVPQSVNWSSLAASTLTVSATGMATRIGIGNVTVRACSTENPTVCGRIVIGMP